MADQAMMEEIEDDALQRMIDAIVDEHPPRQSGTERKAQIEAALTQGDLDVMADLSDKLSRVLYHITANRLDEHGLLTSTKLYDLMCEHLDLADVNRLLEVRYQMRRSAIFAHITETNRANNVADPEHAYGEAPVPVLKKRWCREGGKAKATLDHEKLAAALGDRAQEVFSEVVIPAQVQTKLNEDALLALVNEDPAVLEIVKDCVVIGPRRSARLCVREWDQQ